MGRRMSARGGYEVLVPGDRAGTVLAGDDEAGLVALFDDPPLNPASGAHVRAVMLASVDGATTGADLRSGSLSDEADRRLFGALRALADVVLVGAGTVRAEGYGTVQVPDRLRELRAARGRPERVELAVVSGTASLPDEVLDSGALVVASSRAAGFARLRSRIGDERLVLADAPDDLAPTRAAGAVQPDGRAASAPTGPADVPERTAAVDLATAVHGLATRGLTRVHAEGGPLLLGGLARAGVLDEVCLTVAPLLVGGFAARVVNGTAYLDPPLSLELVHLLRAGSTLLGRWRVA